MTERLTAACTKARVKEDKTALLKAIADAKALESGDYTPESFALVKDALAIAEAILENELSTREEIDEATAVLAAAMENLVKKSGTAEPGADTPTGDAGLPLGLALLGLLSGAALFLSKKRKGQ